ncbi:hypothetical protein EV651_105297 [Kribbella sp. VKM Ac-2571]|nr:hypothetical protein EV651_105297 [Kribbella sp. VKM Ac-2571]
MACRSVPTVSVFGFARLRDNRVGHEILPPERQLPANFANWQ